MKATNIGRSGDWTGYGEFCNFEEIRVRWVVSQRAGWLRWLGFDGANARSGMCQFDARWELIMGNVAIRHSL